MTDGAPEPVRRCRHGRTARHAGLVALFVVTVAASAVAIAAGAPVAPAAATDRAAGAGCGVARAAGDRLVRLAVAGLTRTAVVHLPAGYTGHTPLPLVLNLHGANGDGAGQEAFSGMDATSNADHFVVAYPTGAIGGGGYFHWDVAQTDTNTEGIGNPHDVAFLVDLVGALERQFCVDRSRVYATGYSEGAQMVSELGCDASGVFAAIAPVSGLRHIEPCDAKRPVPILSFHGLADDIEPYNGGIPPWWTYGVPTALARWVMTDHCRAPPIVEAVQPEVHLTEYAHCAGGARLELYVLATEGHEWPGGPVVTASTLANLGPQYEGLSADDLIWRFFERYRLG